MPKRSRGATTAEASARASRAQLPAAFTKLLDAPEGFFSPSEPMAAAISSAMASLFGHAARRHPAAAKLSTLSSEGFDEEGIWAQLELNNKPALKAAKRAVKALLADLDAVRLPDPPAPRRAPARGFDEEEEEEEDDGGGGRGVPGSDEDLEDSELEEEEEEEYDLEGLSDEERDDPEQRGKKKGGDKRKAKGSGDGDVGENEEAPLASDGFFDWDDMDREADMRDDDFDSGEEDEEEEGEEGEEDEDAVAAREAMLERARKRRKKEEEEALLDDAFEGGDVDEEEANATYEDFFAPRGEVQERTAIELEAEAEREAAEARAAQKPGPRVKKKGKKRWDAEGGGEGGEGGAEAEDWGAEEEEEDLEDSEEGGEGEGEDGEMSEAQILAWADEDEEGANLDDDIFNAQDEDPAAAATPHGEKQAKLGAAIGELEDEALAAKPWLLQGESKAHHRPENSLLEADMLDIERATAPAPEVSLERSASLEETIRQRAADRNWDDVVRRQSASEEAQAKQAGTANARGKQADVSMERDGRGLGDVYAAEYEKRVLGAAGQSDEKAEERKVLEALFADLSGKLDALSNFSFTPKPVGHEMEVQTAAVPAIAMEEAVPMAVSEGAARAPEEVYAMARGKGERGAAAAAEGGIRGASEMTQEERKRVRRQFKRAKKKESAREEADDKLAAKLNPGLGNRYAKQKLMDELSRSRNVTTGKVSNGEAGSQYTDSSKFFKSLQQQVDSEAKHGPADKKKKKPYGGEPATSGRANRLKL